MVMVKFFLFLFGYWMYGVVVLVIMGCVLFSNSVFFFLVVDVGRSLENILLGCSCLVLLVLVNNLVKNWIIIFDWCD